MKKIILSAAILAGLAFASCSKDDDKKGNDNDNCVTCEAKDLGQGISIEEETVCKGENGNAFVDGVDQEESYDSYVEFERVFRNCN